MPDANVLTFTLRIDLPALLRDLDKGLNAIASMVEKAQKIVVRLGVDIEDARKQAREAEKAIDDEIAKASRKRDERGRYAPSAAPRPTPIPAPAAPSRAPSGPANTPMIGPDAMKTAEGIKAMLASLRAAEAEMKRLGQTGSEEFKIIQRSIQLAEAEEKKFAAQSGKTAGMMAQMKGQLGSVGGQMAQTLGLDKLMNLLPGMQSGFGSLFSTIGSGNPILSAALAAATALAAGFGALLHIGEEFHSASNKIRVATGAEGMALEELNDSLKKVYASTGSGNLQSMAQTLGELHSMTGAAGPPLEKLTGQFAKLESMNMGVSVKSFARYIGDAGIPTDQASKSLDRLYVTAQQSGISIEEITRLAVQYGAPMRNFGFTTEESTGLLAKFQKEGVNTGLVMGSLRIASGKFARAGIDLREGLGAAIEKIKAAGSASQATAIAMGTFGARAGADMADAIRGGHFEMTKWLADLKNSPDTIDKAKEATKDFGSSFKVLQRNAEVAVAPIGEFIMDVLDKAARGVNVILVPVLRAVGAVVSATVLPALHKMEDFFGFISDHSQMILMIVAPFIGLAIWLEKDFGLMSALWDAAKEFLGLGWDLMTMPFSIIVDLVGSIISLFSGAAGEGITFREVMEKVKLAVIQIEAGIAGLRAGIASVKDSISEGFGALLHGDIGGAFSSLTGMFSKAGDDAGVAYGEKFTEKLGEMRVDRGRAALEEQLKLKGGLDAGEQVAKLQAQLGRAGTAAEKAEIGKKISELMPGAVKVIHEVDAATGEMTTRYEVNTAAIEKNTAARKAAEGENRGKRQFEIVDGLRAEAQAIDENSKKMASLQNEREGKKSAGLDTKELDKQIEETDKKLKEATGKFSEDMKSAKGSGILENLGPQASAAFSDIQKKFGDTVIAPMEAEAAKSKMGDLLGEAASIKTDLDKQGHVKDLVDRLSKAKTQEERDGLAAQISKAVPSALSGYNKITGAVQVNTQKALEFANANTKSLGPEQQKLSTEFGANVGKLAQNIADARNRQAELGDKIAEVAKKGGDTSKLREEYEKLGTQVKNGTTELGGFIEKGKSMGLVKGDVHDVGTEFGLSAEQAHITADATKDIGTKAKEAGVDVKALAGDFDEISKAANEALNQTKGAYSKLILDLQAALKSGDAAQAASIRAQMAELRKSGKDQVQQVKDDNAAKATADKIFDATVHKAKKIDEQNFADAMLSIRKDAEARNRELQTKHINDERLRDRTAAADRTKQAIADAEEGLRKQNEAIAAAQKSKKPVVIRILTDDGKGTKELISGAAAVREALEKENVARIRAIREQGLDELIEADRKFYEKEFQEETQATSDRTKAVLDGLKLREEQIKGQDARAIAARSRLQIEAIEVNQAEEIDAIIRGDQKYMTAYTSLQAARVALDEATTDEDRKMIRERIAALEGEADKREKALILSDQRVAAIERKAGEERVKITEETEKAIREARAQANIASLAGSEKERAQRIAESEKTLKVELDALAEAERAAQDLRDSNLLSEAEYNRRIASIRAERTKSVIASLEREADAEREYQRKRNIITDMGYRIREAIAAAFDQKADAADRERITKEREKLHKEEQDLRDSLARREITYEEYSRRSAALSQKSKDMEADTLDWKLRSVKAFETAGFTFIRKIGDDKMKDAQGEADNWVNLQKAREVKNAELADARAKGETEKAAQLSAELNDIGKQSSATAMKFFENAAVGMSSRIVDVLATSHDKLKDIGKVFLNTILDLLQAEIPVVSAMILGLSLAQPASIASFGVAGFAEWALLTAALEGLVGVARSAVSSFAEGGFVTGRNTLAILNDDSQGRREFVMPGGPTAKWGTQFEAIRKGASPFKVFARPELSGSSVGIDGSVMLALAQFQHAGSILPSPGGTRNGGSAESELRGIRQSVDTLRRDHGALLEDISLRTKGVREAVVEKPVPKLIVAPSASPFAHLSR